MAIKPHVVKIKKYILSINLQTETTLTSDQLDELASSIQAILLEYQQISGLTNNEEIDDQIISLTVDY